METSKEMNFKLLCQVFLYRELRRSLVTLYKNCDSILIGCFLLSNQKCSTVKGDLADWAYAMPRDQSVCWVGLPLRDETLSNCVDLKETLGSLKQFKVSVEMSRNVFWDSNNWLIRYFKVCCLNQSYSLRKCAPACGLRKCAPVWTNVSRLEGCNVNYIHLSCQENCWLMVNSMGMSCCLSVTVAISLQS